LRLNLILSLVFSILLAWPAMAHDAWLMKMKRVRDDSRKSNNLVQQHSLLQQRSHREILGLDRDKPWSLPTKSLADAIDTIKACVMRFDFVYEEIDDPNTTGRGRMNLARIVDSNAYYDSVEHWVDPPPHNAEYFDSHMQALRTYYETVSQGRITLEWDIWPSEEDSTFDLPHEMSYYGACVSALPADEAFDSVVFGLEQYFIDCFRVADSSAPEIDFSQYEAFFLFHAGADQQNDIGFPQTCSDLFTGYIRYRTDDTIWVDNGTVRILDAMIIPESASQDNRATAINAALAHEFGHQLGLPDLYNTSNFITSVGDFALMDHNGFGTAIDFGYDIGNVFGAYPVYPCAWSRAYLGFVDVVDYREGTDIQVYAGELFSDGTKVVRVPISENEFYLVECRLERPYVRDPVMFADSNFVFLYPADPNTREASGEYDFLLPASGLAIYHVDEGVTVGDVDGDGLNNFDDNTLQWNPQRRFIRLMEADGVIDMSGWYEFGTRRYGADEDLFREDRNREFTPNTNPAAIDNSGNNPRVRITDIRRERVPDNQGIPRRVDTLMSFDLETDRLASGFPVRTGVPNLQRFGFSPIVDDLNRDGNPEILFSYDDRLLAVTTDGQNFIHQVSGCDPCVTYVDSAIASVHPGRVHPMPLFFGTPGATITCNLATGDFGNSQGPKYVAVGTGGRVSIVEAADVNNDGLADPAGPNARIDIGTDDPLGISFGDRLWLLTTRGLVLRKDNLDDPAQVIEALEEDEFYGFIRIDDAWIVVGGDTLVEGQTPFTRFYYVTGLNYPPFEVAGRYQYGPVAGDFNRDGIKDIAMFSSDGDGLIVSIDSAFLAEPSFSILSQKETGYTIQVNPVIGDVDKDGYPDIVAAGANMVYAFNHELTLKTNYPVRVNDRFITDQVIAAPIIADMESGGIVEAAFPSLVGNMNVIGERMAYGFPVNSGETGLGSAIYWIDSVGAKLGYKGSDGWFYAWEVAEDNTTDYWPMYGHDASASFSFNIEQAGSPVSFSGFDEDKFYTYPNPVTEGRTTIRYFLAEEASSVQLRIYDLSGREIALLDGPTSGGVDNEYDWYCGDVTPGVYRCIIEINGSGSSSGETAFTDIAIIR